MRADGDPELGDTRIQVQLDAVTLRHRAARIDAFGHRLGQHHRPELGRARLAQRKDHDLDVVDDLSEAVARDHGVGHRLARILVDALDDRADEAQVAAQRGEWIAKVVGNQRKQFRNQLRRRPVVQSVSPAVSLISRQTLPSATEERAPFVRHFVQSDRSTSFSSPRFRSRILIDLFRRDEQLAAHSRTEGPNQALAIQRAQAFDEGCRVSDMAGETSEGNRQRSFDRMHRERVAASRSHDAIPGLSHQKFFSALVLHQVIDDEHRLVGRQTSSRRLGRRFPPSPAPTPSGKRRCPPARR